MKAAQGFRSRSTQRDRNRRLATVPSDTFVQWTRRRASGLIKTVYGARAFQQTVGLFRQGKQRPSCEHRGCWCGFGRGLPEQGYNVAAPYALLRIIGRLNGVYLIGLLQ
jgi:hypothetical protein